MADPERELDEEANPYAPPVSETVEAPRPLDHLSSEYEYRDQTLLVRVLTAMLWLQALLLAFNSAACIALIQTPFSLEMEEKVVSATGVVAWGQRALYFTGVVPFAAFLVRSNKNARAFMAAAASPKLNRILDGFSPASMVWWFFVPIMNFFKPLQAVTAVWNASAPQSIGLKHALHGNLLSFWWTAWIVSSIGSRVSSTFENVTTDPTTYNIGVAVTSAITAVTCVLALRMIHALYERQTQRATEIWGKAEGADRAAS